MAEENKLDLKDCVGRDVKGKDRVWPKYTIKGHGYTRPASTVALGDGYFAVKDTFGNTPEEVKALSNFVNTLTKSSTTKSKSDQQ